MDILSLGHEADHSPPSSAEVKNAWLSTCTPQYVFIALSAGTTLSLPLIFIMSLPVDIS
jgi:hypothetical protein